jgi:glucose-6-phosphate-specific signal transduction histidine kinase
MLPERILSETVEGTVVDHFDETGRLELTAPGQRVLGTPVVPRNEAGLRGLRQRVEALDGSLRIASPEGGPTVVEAVLPCAP